MRAQLLAAVLPVVAAQTNEIVWSAVVVTRHGERTPLIVPGPDALTPLGANQAQRAGQIIRSRYIETNPNARNSSGMSSGPISGIEPYIIDSTQLQIIAPADEVIVNSAQAFMQGLYPPIKLTSNSSDLRSEATLADGTTVTNPLDGYQYGFIDVAGANDPGIVAVWGNVGCEPYKFYQNNVRSSAAYIKRLNETQAFYNGFGQNLLLGMLPKEAIGYENAFPIFDYANYMYYHNGTSRAMMSKSDLDQLRYLSNEQQWAFNGNLTSGGSASQNIQAISGRTLAYQILEYFSGNMISRGVQNKLNLVFTSHEPFLSFFALAGLDTQSPNFRGLPEYGSSMVFELFSKGTNTSQYPTSSQDLFVRFLYRNGSMLLDQDTSLVQYPFNRDSPSQANMPYANFQVAINNMQVQSPAEWCTLCASPALFCAAFDDSGTFFCPAGTSGKSKGVSQPVAGVIGAVVTLAVVALGLLAAFFIGGIRFTSQRNRSQLGGFKGAEKMASDADLSLTKSAAAPAGAAVADPRGHERVGSWEMKDGANPNLQPGSNHHDSGFANLSAAGRSSFQRASFETGHESLGPNPEAQNRFA